MGMLFVQALKALISHINDEKMQLDVEVSPPANIINIIWIPYGHGFILEMLLKYCLGIF